MTLIGGSPGPDAEGTWRGLLLVLVVAIFLVLGILYSWQYATHLSLPPSSARSPLPL